MSKDRQLLEDSLLNYYSKEELGYRLAADTKLEEFWPKTVEYRQAKGQNLPFEDQQGQKFWFVLTPPLLELLHRIDTKGKDSLYDVVKEEIRLELVNEALIEEALFSSVIEGAFSTLARARELIRQNKKPRDTSEQMIVNNAKVMRYVLEQRDASCSKEFMHTLQRLVTEKMLEDPKDAGRFRTDLVYIYNANGEVVYTAPPAETVNPSMQKLVDWVNRQNERPFIHPIVCATIVHTYFVYVHPYVDGNGRTARSLFYWYLLKNRYEFFRYFSISSIIKETRAQYYKVLKDMEDCHVDMTYVLLYMAGTVVQAIDVVLQRIMERYRRDLLLSKIQDREIPLNDRQRTFLKRLATTKDKRGTMAKYQKDFGVVYETARRDLRFLESNGILARKTEGKKFVYLLNPAFLR